MREQVLKEAEHLRPPTASKANEVVEKTYSPFSRLNLKATVRKEQSPMREVEKYLTEPRCLQDDVMMDYWRNKEKEMPTLARLARRYLSVPPTSADVERMFSIAGFLMRARRSRISIKHVADILMYREYRDL